MSASSKIVDFSNVKDGGNFNRNRIPAGDYLAKIIDVKDEKSKKDDAFQYLFTIQIVKRTSSKLPYYCKLVDNQLWKLRNLLIAGGINVPKSKQKVDVNRLVGKQIGVTVEDDDFEEKEQSSITAVFPAAELLDAAVVDDDDDESDDDSDDSLEDDGDDSLEEDDSSTDDEDEAEEVEEDEAEEEEDTDDGDEWDAITDRLELRKALKKVAPDVKTTTKQTEDDIRNLIREAIAAQEKAKAKPAAKKKTKAVSDDELDELDLDDL